MTGKLTGGLFFFVNNPIYYLIMVIVEQKPSIRVSERGTYKNVCRKGSADSAQACLPVCYKRAALFSFSFLSFGVLLHWSFSPVFFGLLPHIFHFLRPRPQPLPAQKMWQLRSGGSTAMSSSSLSPSSSSSPPLSQCPSSSPQSTRRTVWVSGPTPWCTPPSSCPACSCPPS